MLLNAKQNMIQINSNLSGDVVKIIYRNPSTEERTAYRMKKYERVGNEVKVNISEARIAFAKKVITDVENIQYDNGAEIVTVSKNLENWKELLEKFVPHLLELCAAKIFDEAFEIVPPDPEIKKNSGKI